MADIKSLEHSTLKVPYEVLNKKFRSGQKSIDKEVARIQSSGNEWEKTLKKPGGVTAGEMTSVLGNMVENLSLLKRKAEEALHGEVDSTQTIKRRVQHLKKAEENGENQLPSWQNTRLDRMLVEYFLRAGFYNTAINLASSSGIEDLTNVELFQTSRTVEESLKQGKTGPCLSWCHENRSKLKKQKSTLEFNIRKQEFVELIKQCRVLDAVTHARKYFSSSEADHQLEIQQVMGMLAFSPSTTVEAYRNLFQDARWDDLVHQFRQENFRLHQLNSTVFNAALQAGLSSLKTPNCYKEESQRNSDCPVCSHHLNELARPLPFAHCSNSRLICAFSGQFLNEHNPPMVLPNGSVYGLSALRKMASENENRITCPRTKETFHIEEAEKVYVM